MRQSLQPIFVWDFERVIMAHGSIIEQDGKRQFQLGYELALRWITLHNHALLRPDKGHLIKGRTSRMKRRALVLGDR